MCSSKTLGFPRLSTFGTKDENGLDELRHLKDEGDLLSCKAGLGIPMLNAKHRVQVPEIRYGTRVPCKSPEF